MELGEEEHKVLLAEHCSRSSDPCIRGCMVKEGGAGRKDDVAVAQRARGLHDQVIVVAVRWTRLTCSEGLAAARIRAIPVGNQGYQ